MEDLVYIDDLEIIIYTTISPKSSTIFVTHTKKATSQPKELEVITLSSITKKNPGQPSAQGNEDQELMQNRFELLARLRGHRNQDPPTICYVAQSGCLVSGEKHLSEQPYKPNKDSMP